MSESIANGMHYKNYTIRQGDVGQPLDPAFIAAAMAASGNPLSGMQFTILKKALRMGSGDKSKEQDLKDIIGAANREILLDRRLSDVNRDVNGNPPETAPKDCQIMAYFGWPWLQPAIWCNVTEQWAVAQYNSCKHSGEWYETEWHEQSELRGWMPYPQLQDTETAEEHF